MTTIYDGNGEGDLGFMLGWMAPVQQALHDIRSPIAALEAAAYRGGSELPAETLELIQLATRRIRSITETLRPISQAPAPNVDMAQRFHSDVVRTAAHAVIKDVIGEMKAVLDHRRPPVRLSYLASIEAQRLKTMSNPGQLARILANLIQNSAEAIEASGSIRVTLSSAGSHLLISVRDTGKGIAPEDLPRVTERGFTKGKSGGSGLGLSHAAEQVRNWGGEMRIHSAPGRGSCVELRLPLVETSG